MGPASPPSHTLPSPRGSPTANRIALGRPVPLPLNLAMQRQGDTVEGSVLGSPSPSAADEALTPSASSADSPTTLEPAAADHADADAHRLLGAEQTPMQHLSSSLAPEDAAEPVAAPGRSPLPAQRSASSSASPGRAHPSRRSSSKLPLSASTISLGARTVLGYTSSRRAGSPFRSAGGTSAAPLATASTSATTPAPTTSGMASSSRFLLTVVPPEHLPHDPPHPRTNPQCSGYGPPQHFRRGILVPLYPTLSSQLAAIAREYGLPSTGGLVLYLLSTTNPATQQPFPQAAGFAGDGGPRISEGAWNLLWGQLIAEEEAERDMLAFQMQQREQELLDSEDEADDEGYHPPPVPPIPSEHVERRQRQVSEDAALFSDEQERVSQSSDAGASGDGSIYSTQPGARTADTQTLPLNHRASAIARAGLGRGPPPSALSSPAAGTKRFTSLPAAAARHSSRHSIRSASQRPPARAISYSSSRLSSTPSSLLAPSVLPGYGAAVVVGKVEFDIHAGSRQGKWYEGWLASAAQPAAQPQSVTDSSTSGVSTPAAGPTPAQATTSEQQQPWQELHLPGILAAGAAAKTPLQSTSSKREPCDDADEPATPHASHRAVEEAAINQAVELGPAGHDDEERHDADSSIVDKLVASTGETERTDAMLAVDASSGAPPPLSRAASSFPSRPASNASTLAPGGSSASERGTDDTPPMDSEGAAEVGYAPLADEDDEVKPAEYASSAAGSDGSRYGRPTEEDVEFGDDGEQPAPLGPDPLGDVFQSDEATWRDVAADEQLPRLDNRDMLETTGLGIVGTRNIAELEARTGSALLERRTEDQTLDEQGLPPPQDDVRDVMAMLSTTPTTATHPINLASPIRLDSSAGAATETGVFPPSPGEDAYRTDLDGPEERTSPFLPAHSTRTSISTVNFTVRPPSTIASMSPEFVATRKQRQGWTSVPPVVDPSLSASSSLSSIAPLASDSARSSTDAGLMENLDDLERALAELSPRASARTRMGSSPATILEEAGEAPALELDTVAAAASAHPPRIQSREQSEEGEVAPYAAPVPSPSLLAGRPTFRYRTLGSVSGAAGEPLAQAREAGELAYAPPATEIAPPSPAAELVRIPRTSSLHKPEGRVAQPHLVALPPSPLPGTIAAFVPSPDTLEEPLPPLPSASPSWPAAPALPPSPSPSSDPFAGFAASQAPPVPPVSNTDAVSPPPPRSPGLRKGFRAGKWGSKSKSIDAGKANAAANADAQVDEPTSHGSKSPLGAFFGKFGKGDKKGFFRRGDSASPEPPVPASLAAVADAAPELPALPARQASFDVGPESLITGFDRPHSSSFSASTAASEVTQPHEAVPPLSATLAGSPIASPAEPSGVSALSNLTEAEQRNELFSVAARAPVPAYEAAPVRAYEAAELADPSTSLLSAAAFDAFSSSPMPSPPAVEPAAPAPAPALAPIDAASVPLPPAGPGSALSSPRASSILSPTALEFSSPPPPAPAPGTPRAPASTPAPPTSRYPASAPVTPAAWALATPRTAGGGSGARKAQRLSADIDMLLSQMRDIEFLDAESVNATANTGERRYETVAQTQRDAEPLPPALVEPAVTPADDDDDEEEEEDTSLAYDGGELGPPTLASAPALVSVASSPPAAGLLLAPPPEGESIRPLSEDLRALGSIMTGLGMASPPMSPEHAPAPALAAAPA
ncbi:hypothetical protein JCM3770_006382 [Rhodotorula araucariae]